MLMWCSGLWIPEDPTFPARWFSFHFVSFCILIVWHQPDPSVRTFLFWVAILVGHYGNPLWIFSSPLSHVHLFTVSFPHLYSISWRYKRCFCHLYLVINPIYILCIFRVYVCYSTLATVGGPGIFYNGFKYKKLYIYINIVKHYLVNNAM